MITSRVVIAGCALSIACGAGGASREDSVAIGTALAAAIEPHPDTTPLLITSTSAPQGGALQASFADRLSRAPHVPFNGKWQCAPAVFYASLDSLRVRDRTATAVVAFRWHDRRANAGEAMMRRYTLQRGAPRSWQLTEKDELLQADVVASVPTEGCAEGKVGDAGSSR